jgi:tRNA (adenine22-N1)-methyltransferase
MNVGARLTKLADLVPPCDVMIDVGTDHAYLPVLLTRSGKVRRAIAGDIGAGPCEAARKTVSLYHCGEMVDVRLGSGLTVVSPGEVNSIVMAGMGAETMLGILAESPDIWQDPSCKTMILQPMSDSDRLRHWCETHGWGIQREELVEEAHKIYEILVLVPCPGYHYEGRSYLVGDDLVRRRHPLLIPFVSHLKEKYERLLESMQQSPRAMQSEHYQACRKIYEELEEIQHGNYNQ